MNKKLSIFILLAVVSIIAVSFVRAQFPATSNVWPRNTGTTLGFGSVATGLSNGIAIGGGREFVWSDAEGAVQIGGGSNNVPFTFNFRGSQVVGPLGGAGVSGVGEWLVVNTTQLVFIASGVTNVIDADITSP